MNIIAIECSHPKASLCLSKGGKIVHDATWETARNHDSYLFPALKAALALLGAKALDIILVGAGPGSYGGVRVAIAAASGISIVKGCRLAAIDSWAQLSNGQRLIISDAKRGGWTLRQLNGAIEVHSLEEMLQLQESGQTFSSLEKKELHETQGLFAEKYELVPSAKGLLSTWNHLSEEQQQSLCEQVASPIYVRPPHITKAKRKPWEC